MSEWISVDDLDLYIDGKCIDLWIDVGDFSGRVENCFYSKEDEEFWRWSCYMDCKKKIPLLPVTHWMLAPEPPKDKPHD